MKRLFAAAMPATLAVAALFATPGAPTSLVGKRFQAQAEMGTRLLTFDKLGVVHCDEEGKDCNIAAE